MMLTATHVNIIRLAPPLVITEEQVRFAVNVIKESLEEIDVIEEVPGETAKEKAHKQGLP